MIFRRRKRIRFHHCDPAGIVFYPQYLVLCNEVVEDWFAEALDLNFFELHSTHARGVPMRHLEADFMAPSTHGEELEFCLSVERIGRSSLLVRIRAEKEGKTCFLSRQTMVWASIETGVPKAIAIDAAWRERFTRFLEPSSAEG